MFSPEQAERICSKIQSGMTTRQVAESENVPQSEIVKNAGRNARIRESIRARWKYAQRLILMDLQIRCSKLRRAMHLAALIPDGLTISVCSRYDQVGAIQAQSQEVRG